MKRFQGVTKRPGSSVYQWGIKAPTDLRGLYPTQWAHRCTLDTTDLREANAKAARLHAEWTARFETERLRLNPTVVEIVAPDLAEKLATGIRHRILSADDSARFDQQALVKLLGAFEELSPSGWRNYFGTPDAKPAHLRPSADAFGGMTPAQLARLREFNDLLSKFSTSALARGDLSFAKAHADAEAQRLGLSVRWERSENRPALVQCLRAAVAAFADRSRRDAGEVVETPEAPAVPRETPAAPQRTAKPVRLRDVLPKWKAAKRRKPQTERAAENALALFEEATGNPPIAEITRAQGADFKAWLLTLGTSDKTAHGRLDCVKGFLNFASRELELIPRNPWEGLSIEYATTTPRRPWSLEQLQTLAARPLFTGYAVPSGWKAGLDAAYWMPLLGLFTGARVSELAQLRTQDVETVDGVALIRITDESEGASVKTKAARRLVPVHPELIRLGFLEYATAIREAGAVSLWPALRLLRGKPGKYFSDWFSAELRPTADGAKLPDFHSLRHTVRSRLASAGIAEPMIDALIGHEIKGSTGARTYTQRTTEDLRGAVERLSYPGLSLPRVFTAPAWSPETSTPRKTRAAR